MSWWMWAVLAWIVVSVPAGLVIGRVIARAQERDRSRQRERTDTPPGTPRPRDGWENRSA